MTITEFLLARIAEDEAHATRVPTDWLYPEDYPALEMTEIGPGHTLIVSPTRVLAECQAKRAIIADCQRYVAERRRMMNGWLSKDEEIPDPLRHLAAVYADHPDYRQGWKP